MKLSRRQDGGKKYPRVDWQWPQSAELVWTKSREMRDQTPLQDIDPISKLGERTHFGASHTNRLSKLTDVTSATSTSILWFQEALLVPSTTLSLTYPLKINMKWDDPSKKGICYSNHITQWIRYRIEYDQGRMPVHVLSVLSCTNPSLCAPDSSSSKWRW